MDIRVVHEGKRERDQGRNWEVGIRREVGEGEDVTQTIRYGLG